MCPYSLQVDSLGVSLQVTTGWVVRRERFGATKRVSQPHTSYWKYIWKIIGNIFGKLLEISLLNILWK
jgi:hypothetical protein